MKLKDIIYILTTLIITIPAGCGKEKDPEPEPPLITRPKTVEEYNKATEGLKDYFDRETYFTVGAAVEPAMLDNAGESVLLKRHFNSITAENVMKWQSLQPSEGNFNYTDADKLVTFALANNMAVHGHTLCWHNQTPDWVFKDGSATASKELVLQRLRTHITTVMTHFKGRVTTWDVVNEAIDDGSATYRNSKWYQICGEDYITEAFKAARESDPDALLFYNDYSEVNPVKRDKIYDLLKKLSDQQLIDGMGLQCHWNIDYPSNELLTEAIGKYSSIGLELRISELDVSVYTSDAQTEKAYDNSVAVSLAAAYSRYFKVFRDNKDKISGVTMWGMADNHTWLDNFPVSGRKDYPLLFAVDLVPKQAYFTVINF